MPMTRENYRNAATETLELAVRHGLQHVVTITPDGDYAHLAEMERKMRTDPRMNLPKLGRWIGWIQGCLYVSAKGAVTLDEMKAINKRNSVSDEDWNAGMDARLRTIFDGLDRACHYLESPQSYSKVEKSFVYDSITSAKDELESIGLYGVERPKDTVTDTTVADPRPGFEFVPLLEQQKRQHVHDMRNHHEIVSLHRTDRVKHYGLHFGKYVGRLARGTTEPKTEIETLVDAFLVVLSSANALQQDLSKETWPTAFVDVGTRPLLVFADATGRYADACEKIDHMEHFLVQIREANRDVAAWLIRRIQDAGIDILEAAEARRHRLAERQFYVAD